MWLVKYALKFRNSVQAPAAGDHAVYRTVRAGDPDDVNGDKLVPHETTGDQQYRRIPLVFHALPRVASLSNKFGVRPPVFDA